MPVGDFIASPCQELRPHPMTGSVCRRRDTRATFSLRHENRKAPRTDAHWRQPQCTRTLVPIHDPTDLWPINEMVAGQPACGASRSTMNLWLLDGGKYETMRDNIVLQYQERLAFVTFLLSSSLHYSPYPFAFRGRDGRSAVLQRGEDAERDFLQFEQRGLYAWAYERKGQVFPNLLHRIAADSSLTS